MLGSKYREMVAYASAFVAFILPRVDVKEIILFGSVARGEATKESDIDLFFNVEKESEKVNGIINNELIKFQKSKIAEVWRLKGVTNEIKVKVGELGKWGLKRSIISEGILLYGKYYKVPEKLRHLVFFQLSPIKDITKRNRVVRKLFGRREKGYVMIGEVEKTSGRRISSLSFVVPIEKANDFIKILSSEKVGYIFFEIWTDQVL